MSYPDIGRNTNNYNWVTKENHKVFNFFCFMENIQVQTDLIIALKWFSNAWTLNGEIEILWQSRTGGLAKCQI